MFISYCHADAKWMERLRVHLKPLERQGAIALWEDTRIKPGSHWREEIQNALTQARAAVLLVTADFLASDFISTNELPPLLRAAKERGVRILPVIIKPCRFEQTEGLSGFQAVNSPSKPLIALGSAGRERLFSELSGIVEEALRPAGAVAEQDTALHPRNRTNPRSEKLRAGERDEFRLQFWQQLLDLAKRQGLPFHANRSPTTAHYIGGGAGIVGYSWNYVIWVRQEGAVELLIDTQDKGNNERAFDILHQRKAQIEASFGAPLEWNRLNDSRRCEIRYTVRAGDGTAPEERWPAIQSAMVDAMARLTKSLQPYLASLPPDLGFRRV